ncbi:hypothetical protein D3C71_1797130 [compost metagenome]
MLDQRRHDGLAQAAPLMGGIDGDIDDLEEQTPVTDHPAHAHRFARQSFDHHGENGVGQADRSGFGAARGQARDRPQATILLDSWRAGDNAVVRVHVVLVANGRAGCQRL